MAVAGVTICVEGALAGVAVVADGIIDIAASASNFDSDWNNLVAAYSSRSKNNICPCSDAQGDHTVFKRDGDTGQITNYKTYKVNPQNPSGFDEVIGYDGVGKPHYNSKTGEYIPTPHVHDKKAPGKIRFPYDYEISKCLED